MGRLGEGVLRLSKPVDAGRFAALGEVQSSRPYGGMKLTLSRYLWPTYSDDVSNFHVLLIALMVGVKRREGVPIWSTVQPKS